jgi:predicted outer membrane repeat protein
LQFSASSSGISAAQPSQQCARVVCEQLTLAVVLEAFILELFLVVFLGGIVSIGVLMLVLVFKLFKHCHVIFSNNSGGYGAGIIVTGDSEMVFKDNVSVVFDNNTGVEGGPLCLQTSTAIIFNATSINNTITLQFKNNKAKRGGAIHVKDDANYIKSIFDLQCSTALVTLIFVNNSASLGGNQIYGGWVDWLQDQDGVIRYRPDTMKEILNFNNSSDSEVSSCAVRVCLCKDGHPECNITNAVIEIYGYTVSLDLVAVGQRFTPVAAYVMANMTSSKSRQRNDTWEKLWMTTNIFLLGETCTNVKYKIFPTQADTLHISPVSRDCAGHDFEVLQNVNYDFQMPRYSINDSVTVQAMLIFQQLSIHLKPRKCPIGFFLHRTNRNCACQPSLLSLGLSCDTITFKIRRNKHQWVAIAHEHTVTSSMVILHPYCPFDYCRTDNESLSIRLEDESELCAFNRSGILCGGCATNFSRVLGSSRCEVCSMNFQMFGIILLWFLSGPILVILLMLLDITVSVGTINGLTFYANIIHAQRATFFTLEMSSPFLSMFIAWLNLDQGFETCFYDRLDEYNIAWLKFLFPLYIWLIAAVLIMISHYSTRISNLIGNNAVQVLATLFFISYTKLLQLIIEVFSFTTLNYPDGYKKTVWLIDGNIEFLKGKHIPLFLVTVVFILFSFPYTIILLIIQFLYKISHYRTMFWVQRLKPLFDAYTGPYRDNHRYWTGLLLIARIVLLVVFTLNKKDDTSINLFSIILVSSVLVGWLGLTDGSVYKHPLKNLLEVAFLCNLGITSTVVFFNDKGSTVAVNVSVTLALIILIGIIIFHAQRRLLLTNFGSELKKQASNFIVSKLKEVVNCGYKLRQCCKWEWKRSTVVPMEPLLIEAEPEQQGTY